MRRMFRFPWRRGHDIREDVETEIAFHLDARTEALAAAGVPRDEARRRAAREFGDLEDARSHITTMDRGHEAAMRRKDYVDDLRQDLTYSLRQLRRAPAFALTAIITLAIGIGANVAIFSVVKGVLLNPLPYPDPGRVVRLYPVNHGANISRGALSPVSIDDWRAQARKFVDIGGYFFADGMSGIDLTGSGEPRRLTAAFITPGFFPALGVGALEGRLPREAEMVRGGPDKVVVLSYGFWQRQFGGAHSAVNAPIILNDAAYQVVGVMPAAFAFPSEHVDVWIPYSTIPDDAIPRLRGVRSLSVIARVKPDASLAEAAADMNGISRRLARDFPSDEGGWDSAELLPLRKALTGDVERSLLVLLGAVAFVLLAVCVNVAGLLLARATGRRREMAVRLALGAARARVLRQLLTESVVLALFGGVAGIVAARAALGALLRLSADQLPRGAEVHLDATVLAAGLTLSLLTGLLFGLVPAIRASSPRLHDALRAGTRGTAGASGNRLRNGLVVAELALATMLAVGAGLMTRSFEQLLRVDPGFKPDHLVAIVFTISPARHQEYRTFYHQVLDQVRALPGVVSAGAVRDAPFQGDGERWTVMPPGVVAAPGQQPPEAQVNFISDGYLPTIGVPVLEGRDFTPQDRPEAGFPVLINQTMARRYFPNGHAVGSTIRLGFASAQVVGVVGDIRQSAMDEPARPTMYVDNMVQGRVKTTLVVRTRGEPLAMARSIRDAIWSLDREQTITSIFTFESLLSDAVARPRLLTVLLGTFGALGLVLGAVGLYGVLGYLVSQRQREIGVRLALGAAPGAVSRMIVGRGLGLGVLGVGLGVAGSLALTRFLAGVLYGVTPTDALTFAGIPVLLLLTVVAASWLPARRASRVDPVVTLRAD